VTARAKSKHRDLLVCMCHAQGACPFLEAFLNLMQTTTTEEQHREKKKTIEVFITFSAISSLTLIWQLPQYKSRGFISTYI